MSAHPDRSNSEAQREMRPCRVYYASGRPPLDLLAVDYEAAVIGLEEFCREEEALSSAAVFIWDQAAIDNGWKRP